MKNNLLSEKLVFNGPDLTHTKVEAVRYMPSGCERETVEDIAGIWGMNFKYIPEIGWRYGYVAAWILMILSGVGCYFIFRAKK